MITYDDIDGRIGEVIDRLVFKVHPTPESVLEAHNGCPLSEIEEVGGVDETGVEHTVTVEQLVESVRGQGIWGFIDKPGRTIHYWRSAESSDSLMATFLGHEMMHAIDIAAEDAELREELICEAAGIIAAFVLNLFTRPK